jgi:NAD(P)-dependent dehydrogenase (short-subunit alcohol dehydrogenase family)
MISLADKVALVTGAGRGLGWGIARALGQAGARVCIVDINDEEMARAASDLKKDGTKVIALHLDVSDLEAFHSVVNQIVSRWGRLDLVVHNAIYMPLVLFEDLTLEEWWRQINVGLGGLYNATKASWKVMQAQGGGHIVGIASGSSKKGFKEEVAYCTNKHGQEGFIKALSLEAAPHNISLYSVGPGKVIKPTRITWDELETIPSETKAEWTDPLELGQAFVWLAKQPSSRVNGFRFDAGPIIDSINKEGWDFKFKPEKVTLHPEDMIAAQQWYTDYQD